MSKQTRTLKGLLLPTTGHRLFVPNAAIAEIVPMNNVVPVEDTPNWMLGYLSWRRRSLPLVSFETVVDETRAPVISPRAQIAIVYGLSGNPDRAHMALLIQGIPKVVHLEEKDVESAEGSTNQTHPLVLQDMKIGGEIVGVLDIDALEMLLEKAGL